MSHRQTFDVRFRFIARRNPDAFQNPSRLSFGEGDSASRLEPRGTRCSEIFRHSRARRDANPSVRAISNSRRVTLQSSGIQSATFTRTRQQRHRDAYRACNFQAKLDVMGLFSSHPRNKLHACRRIGVVGCAIMIPPNSNLLRPPAEDRSPYRPHSDALLCIVTPRAVRDRQRAMLDVTCRIPAISPTRKNPARPSASSSLFTPETRPEAWPIGSIPCRKFG